MRAVRKQLVVLGRALAARQARRHLPGWRHIPQAPSARLVAGLKLRLTGHKSSHIRIAKRLHPDLLGARAKAHPAPAGATLRAQKGRSGATGCTAQRLPSPSAEKRVDLTLHPHHAIQPPASRGALAAGSHAPVAEQRARCSGVELGVAVVGMAAWALRLLQPAAGAPLAFKRGGVDFITMVTSSSATVP
jgi:hypothetical protein